VLLDPDRRIVGRILQFAPKGIYMKQKEIHIQLVLDPCAPPPALNWLDTDRYARVEVTSEEKGYPIESALLAESSRGCAQPTREFSESG
jgi:hypothetical protein